MSQCPFFPQELHVDSRAGHSERLCLGVLPQKKQDFLLCFDDCFVGCVRGGLLLESDLFFERLT